MGRHQNLFVLGVGAAGAAASHSWDARLATANWGGGGVHELFEPGRFVGNFVVQTAGSFGTYAIGRLTHSPRVATIGADLFRAGLVAQGTTQLVKFAAGRTRPDGTSRSFPSGHAASAFATASVLQSELGWKAGVPAYAVAAWVAASRVQTDRHYLSDVIAGATIGILAGRSVTVGRGAARFAISPMMVPGGVGAALVHQSSR